jgi:hypothetical protein
VTASLRSSTPPGLTGEDRLSQLSSFAFTYFAHWSENDSDALKFFAAVYSDQVNVHGKPTSARLVLEEKRRFAIQWPERIYTVQPGMLKIRCGGAETCEMVGVVEFLCRNSVRQEKIAGKAEFTLQVSMSAGKLTITGERSSILSYQK